MYIVQVNIYCELDLQLLHIENMVPFETSFHILTLKEVKVLCCSWYSLYSTLLLSLISCLIYSYMHPSNKQYLLRKNSFHLTLPIYNNAHHCQSFTLVCYHSATCFHQKNLQNMQDGFLQMVL